MYSCQTSATVPFDVITTVEAPVGTHIMGECCSAVSASPIVVFLAVYSLVELRLGTLPLSDGLFHLLWAQFAGYEILLFAHSSPFMIFPIFEHSSQADPIPPLDVPQLIRFLKSHSSDGSW